MKVGKILHMSDLHIGHETQNDLDLDALCDDLIEKVESADILIITGDIVFYDKQKENFGKAKGFIEKLADGLKIKEDKIILTPGNHDVSCCGQLLQYDKGNCNLKDCDSNSYAKIVKANENFLSFYGGISLLGKKEKAEDKLFQIIEFDNMNIVTASSVNAYHQNQQISFCLLCEKLKQFVSDNRGKLVYKNKINIFATHCDDKAMCDNVKELLSILDASFEMRLCGHRHDPQADDRLNEYSSGCNYLGEKSGGTDANAHYFIYEFEGEKLFTKSVSLASDNTWVIGAVVEHNGCFPDSKKEEKLNEYFSNALIEEEFKEIKAMSPINKTIFGVDFAKIEYIRNIDNLTDFEKLTNLFSNIMSLQKGGNSNESSDSNIAIEKNVFEQIYALCVSSEKNPLTIKGTFGTGKSTFLKFLFVYILLKQKELFEYVPVIWKVDEDFNLENARNLNKYKHKKILLFIDNIEDVNVRDIDYAAIYKAAKNMGNAKVIFCIDKINRPNPNENNNIKETVFEENRTADNLLYFGSIFKYGSETSLANMSVSATSPQPKWNEFISLFLALNNKEFNNESNENEIIKKINEIIEKINKLKIVEIDFHFLHSFIDKFISNEVTIAKVSDLYTGLLGTKGNVTEKDIAELASKATIFQYGIAKIDRDENALLFRSQQFNDYLVAIDFCNNLKNSKYSVQIFDRQKNYFAQEMLIEEHFAKLVAILGDKGSDIKNKIQSCYLLRGLKNGSEAESTKNSAIEVLKSEYTHIKLDLRKNNDNMGMTVYLCCIAITLATLGNESFLGEYIISLIKNFKKAEVNRRFHLNYYGDSDNVHITTQLSDNLCDIEKNNTKLNAVNKYRYYYSYQHFYARIEKYIREQGNKIMFQLDMFTFLNILQVRMQYHMKKNLSRNYKIPEKFIFDIECAKTLLDKYSKKFNNEAKTTTLDKMLAVYIKMIMYDFAEFLASAKNSAIDDKAALPTPFYQKNMFELFRNNMSSDSNCEQSQETLAVHALSSYCIGFQYLPYRDKKGKDYYDKNDVLRVLLFLDICEAIVCGSNDDKCKEMRSDAALRICCLGTYEGFEDFSQDLAVLYDLINDGNNTANNSAKVISDIDKVYSLYKLFYFTQYENEANKIGVLFYGIKTDVCKQILNKITIKGEKLQVLIDRVSPSIRNINKW